MVILLELDPNDGMAIKKTYIYANSEVLAQHNGDHTADRYFYLHDRLGSVRQVIDNQGVVVNHYTYDPWGKPIDGETTETVSNMCRFANYIWDSEISMYYCVARMYDPVLGRFTSRDPVKGSYQQPMSLHRYLYCSSDPINRKDPTGEIAIPSIFTETIELYEERNEAISTVVNFGKDGFDMAEGLINVQNTVAATVEARGLADRAFKAIGCINQAKGQFMISLMECTTSGIKGQILSAGGCILGCALSGPAIPLCLGTCGLVTGIGGSVMDTGCMIGASGAYLENMNSCLNE